MLCIAKFLFSDFPACSHRHGCTRTPPLHFGSPLARGPKRDLQLFPGHCLHTTIVCYLLPPLLPPSSSPLHLPSSPAPLPKLLLLCPLAAPFLNSLPATTTRAETNVAFAAVPTRADAARRSHCTLQVRVRGQWAQCHDLVALGTALRPHQPAWTRLPSQPTGHRARGCLLGRRTLSWWWVPGFPKMCDLDETARMKETQPQLQHSDGNAGTAAGSAMQQSISGRAQLVCFESERISPPNPTLTTASSGRHLGFNIPVEHLHANSVA